MGLLINFHKRDPQFYFNVILGKFEKTVVDPHFIQKNFWENFDIYGI
jgi:hypothetical protein